MTDDQDVGRRLLEVVVAGEPPLRLRADDLVDAGRRRRLGRRVVGAGGVLAAAAGVTAVVLLAATARPAQPTYVQPTVIVRTPDPLPTASEGPAPGPVDVLTPAQEQELVRVNGAAFRQAYRPPAGWTLKEWVPFVDDPGISDEAWHGGALLTDSAGRYATVFVGLSVANGASCPGVQQVPLPTGGQGTLSRDGKALTVCAARPGGLVVSAVAAPGDFPVQRPGDVSAPDAPEGPTVLAALCSDPGFRWPG